MHRNRLIYLDNAATSLPKPPEVSHAIAEGIQSFGGAGRGSHPAAIGADEALFNCRSEIADFFSLYDPKRVVLTQNATHALNLAISSLAGNGSHAVISSLEHNAVLRPVHALTDTHSIVPVSPQTPSVAVDGFWSRLRGADFAVCTVASNVFGTILPIEEIDAVCADAGVPLIIDASQTAGILPLDVSRLRGTAFVAFPGHKGLLGPQGTGALLVLSDKFSPLIRGGTGSNSADPLQPDFLPDALESGTQNSAGAYGLTEGIRFLRRMGRDAIFRHEIRLTELAENELSKITAVHCIPSADRVGIISFTVDGMDCQQVANRLADDAIAVRAGLHCAPLAHRSAGTFPNGTVRVSFGPFNRESDVFALSHTVKHIVTHRDFS